MSMNKQTVIYVVRHGQAELNVKHTIGGTLEPNLLTSEGRKQALKLAENLKNIQIDKVYSSDLSRAKQTAEIIASKIALPVAINKLLRERSWGSLQGKTFEEAKKIYPEAFKNEAEIEGQRAFKFRYVRDMESLGEAVMRFKRFLETITSKQQGKTVLIVSHFDIIVGYLVDLGLGSYQKLMNANFNHAGYYTLIYSNGELKIGKIVGLNIR